MCRHRCPREAGRSSARGRDCETNGAARPRPLRSPRPRERRASGGPRPRRVASARRPSAPRRSATSTRQRRSTSGGGGTYRASYRCGDLARRSSRTSRKPAVVISAVRAPRRSRIAFVATVVPWITSVAGPTAPSRGERFDDVRDCTAEVGRGRHDLADRQPAVAVDERDVRERAADVRADPRGGLRSWPLHQAADGSRGGIFASYILGS